MYKIELIVANDFEARSDSRTTIPASRLARIDHLRLDPLKRKDQDRQSRSYRTIIGSSYQTWGLVFVVSKDTFL